MMTAASATCSRFGKLVSSIGTHSGKFHCDEVLAVYMLQCLTECKNAAIVRTRDPHALSACDVVVDVGGVYDPATFRFDHHQREFQESMRTLSGGDKHWSTRLSSAGLVYFHFGRDVITSLLQKQSVSLTSQQMEALYDHVYATFVEEVDAVDNGVTLYDPACVSGKPRFQVCSTLSHRVSHLNRPWNQPLEGDCVASDEQRRFMSAVQLVGEEFSACVRRLQSVWLPARDIVFEALQQRFQTTDPSGAIIELSSGAIPWRQHLLQLEDERDPRLVQFVIYPDTSARSDVLPWRVQAVPPVGQPDSFLMRTPLKAEWCGLRDEGLREVSGITDAVFVHANGFIGGATSRDSVIKMALESIQCSAS